MTAHEYAWHEAALRGEIRPLVNGVCEAGYYRLPHRNGRSLLMAVWMDNIFGSESEELVATIGNPYAADVVPADEQFFERHFTRASRHPISQELYWAIADGAPWPDAPPENGARSNLPDDPFEALRIEIEGEVAEVERWLRSGPVADQTANDRAKNWSARIHALGKRADALRNDEKRPHLEAGREIDVKWTPLVTQTEALRRRLAEACEEYRKERQRRVAEAALMAATNGAAPARRAATGLRTVKRGEITDYAAFVEAVKDWPDVRQFMADLANKVARAAAPTEVAGLRIVAEQRAY
jgi:hypothetical protein